MDLPVVNHKDYFAKIGDDPGVTASGSQRWISLYFINLQPSELMKVAIITDQHFGARKNSKLFHDYFLKFYNDIFFPYLEENNIKVVIDMGDTFDSRKGIDFSALAWAKNNYYDRLQDMGIRVHTIVGNHTA